MSNGAPPETSLQVTARSVPTLFIDRDTWSHLLDSKLREAGIPFVAHREVFKPDALDPEWIAEVGRRGWLVITRDKNIRRRPNELRAVRDARLHMFALSSGNLSAADTAAIIIKAWPAMRSEVLHTPAPALYSVSRSGSVQLLFA